LLTLIQILQVLLYFVQLVVIIDVVLSILIAFNVVNTYNGFVRSVYDGIERLCQPLYAPIRRVLPATGGVDFSPAVVLILIVLLKIVLGNLADHIQFGTPL
jgi:YggT family protein